MYIRSLQMADFNNLLRDRDDDSASYYPETDIGLTGLESTDRDDQEVPPILAKAEVQRRKMYDKQYDSPEKSSLHKDTHSDFLLDEQEQETAYGLDSSYEKLKVLWLDEMNSPDLLPWDEETFSLMSQLLTVCHEEHLPELRYQARHTGTRSASSADPTLAALAVSICQMDADRVGFILADLARIRLSKIEKYALHNIYMIDRFSDLERQYLKTYGELWEGHMKRHVTDLFPKEIWKKLNEPDMIDHPDLNTFVFCKVEDGDGISIDPYQDFVVRPGHDGFEMGNVDRGLKHYQKGTCLFLRYTLVKDLVLEGKVTLLM